MHQRGTSHDVDQGAVYIEEKTPVRRKRRNTSLLRSAPGFWHLTQTFPLCSYRRRTVLTCATRCILETLRPPPGRKVRPRAINRSVRRCNLPTVRQTLPTRTFSGGFVRRLNTWHHIRHDRDADHAEYDNDYCRYD